MKRLSLYLVREFARDTVALFVIMLALMWMAQWLRLFDVVSGKGQSLLTLFGQAALSLPQLSVVFLYVTVGIGLGRAFTRLQSNQELHIIHAGRQVPALLQAVALYAIGAALVVFLLANFLAPASSRQLDRWRAQVAADLVSRAIIPRHFTEVVPGVVVAIGGRTETGVTDFFADDRRNPAEERTYVAKSAKVGEDPQGYVLQLMDGVLQYRTPDGLSQLDFKRYDLAVDKLTASANPDNLDSQDSLTLLRRIVATGGASPKLAQKLVARANEVLRVIAICLFVVALMGLPHARRGRGGVPIELTVLLAAFLERGITEYARLPSLMAPLSGALLLLVFSAVVLGWRLRVFRPTRLRRASA